MRSLGVTVVMSVSLDGMGKGGKRNEGEMRVGR
jgi:hypothetical protein